MTIADIDLTYSRADLLAALAERRKVAVKNNAERLAAHRVAEREYLAAFRKACREAAKWDYETAKKNSFRISSLMPRDEGGRWERSQPSCPMSEVSQIDSLVAMIGHVSQTRFTLSRSGRWSTAYAVLTGDVPQVEGLC